MTNDRLTSLNEVKQLVSVKFMSIKNEDIKTSEQLKDYEEISQQVKYIESFTHGAIINFRDILEVFVTSIGVD